MEQAFLLLPGRRVGCPAPLGLAPEVAKGSNCHQSVLSLTDRITAVNHINWRSNAVRTEPKYLRE